MERMCKQTRPRFVLSSERVWGNGVRTHVNSMGEIPSTGKKSPQRRIEPMTLYQACAGWNLGWGLNLRALVCGLF